MHQLSSIIFSKCSCIAGRICPFCVQLTISVIAILFGALISWKPRKTIDIQIAFYRLINWELKPISMEKEIRNTRIMGAFVLIAGILTFLYVYLF